MSETEESANGRDVEVLAGGGEMDERISRFDWALTPLGAKSQWQHSLISTLSICLSSRFPMAIYWGDEGFLLYNDAWRPILGDKHPWALGRPAREVWSEIWDVIAPLFESVRTTGEGTWRGDELLPMQRFGYTEECYFDYTFNPIRGTSGKVEGILNVVQETTYRVLNDRRTRLLRELAARSGSAQSEEKALEMAAAAFETDNADIPFALLYLVEADASHARLAAAAGLPENHPARIEKINLASGAKDDGGGWSLGEAFQTAKPAAIDDLTAGFGLMPGGHWSEAATQAIALPIIAAGEETVSAILVSGINPRHRLDDEYHHFFELVAAHVATALTNARAYSTEKRRAESLAELDRAKTEFFSNVSHEFRTPLTLMLGNLEDVLAKDGKVPPDEKRHIETAHRNSLRLLKLVNTLLDFSRIEANRQQADFELTDLSKFTSELASNFRSAMEKAGLKLTIDCPPLSRKIAVDREMWEKIVLNLVSNSFKFTFEGEVKINLREEAGDEIILTVSDTGTGISPENLPHVFERFHRVSGAASRTHEGTGIGLALVKELVKMHGGEIEATSEIGKGATFTVKIPAVGNRAAGEREKRAELKIAAPADSSANALRAQSFRSEIDFLAAPEDFLSGAEDAKIGDIETGAGEDSGLILFADDNRDMREYVRRLLEQKGYRVAAASDGQDALEFLEQNKPDLILSDVMMPRVDGFALLEKIRADGRFREIPVILLSARAGEESKVEGLQAGADDYLIKPFAARELLARVESNLKMARLRRESAGTEHELRRVAEAAKENLERVLSSVSDAFTALDRDFRYLYVNDATLKMSGFGREELIGKTVWEVFPDLVGTPLEETFRRAMSERQTTDFEYFYAAWNRWFAYRFYPTGDGLTIFITEITARKQAEEKLRETGAILSAVSENTSELIYVKDGNCRLIYANPATLDAMGIAEEQAIRSDIAELFPVTDEADEINANDRRIMETGATETVEEIYTGAGGVTRIYLSTKTPLRDGGGAVVGLIGISRDITDRKRTEQVLREREAELREAQRVGSIGSWSWNAATDVSVGSDELLRIYGLNPETDSLPDFADQNGTLYPPESWRQINEAVQKSLASGEGYEFDVPAFRKGGERIWITTRSEVVRDADGNTIGLRGTVQDITERKQAEDKLRRAARFDAFRVKLADALRSLSDAAEIQLTTGRVLGEELSANRVAYFEVRGADYFVERDYTNDAEPLAGGYPIDSFGERLLAAYRSGQAVWSADVTADAELSPEERAAYAAIQIGAFIGVPLIKNSEFVAGLAVHAREPHDWTADDIRLVEEAAERTWAAVTRARAEEALAKSEEKYRALFNSMDEGFTVLEMIFDDDGKPVDYLHLENNPAQQRMTGMPDVTGRRVREVIPDFEDFWLETFGRVTLTGEPVRLESYIKGLDRWFDVFASRIGGEGSRQVALIYNDITDRKLAEQERERVLTREQELRQAAETANRLKDEFLATVSHELRTPLNSMLGWATIARQSGMKSDTVVRALEVIERNARQQNQIIEDILDVSRIITGKLSLQMSSVSLVDVVNAAIETVRPTLDIKQIKLETDFDADAALVTGDASRLQQVVWNLLANAVKFTAENGTIRIELRRAHDSFAEIIVKDNGQGIEPEFLPFVFERFRQEDGGANRKHGGLGLGLAIVRHIVEMHGGTVSVESEGKGSGARFVVRLPLYQHRSTIGDYHLPTERDELTTTTADFSSLAGLRILLVDDEPEALELTETILTQHGAIVETANSARAALKKLTNDSQPAVIVSDVGMPEVDGFELIKKIRARFDGKIPAIALTAYARSEDSARALEAGFNRHLAKPLDANALIRAIADLIERRR